MGQPPEKDHEMLAELGLVGGEAPVVGATAATI
jgi:hypothetical protein